MEWEAAVAFLASAPSGGQVPASSPYATSRDEQFIGTWLVGATRSRIARAGACANLEDAREAIMVGQKAGYAEADIAAYLRLNYVVETPPSPSRFEPARNMRL
jgi:hypothetical protein